jgi:hypothetical protein
MTDQRKSATGSEPMTLPTTDSTNDFPSSLLSPQEVSAAHRRIRKLLRRPRHVRRA